MSGLTNTERDNDLTEHLSEYGRIGRIVHIDSPMSPYHKNSIVYHLGIVEDGDELFAKFLNTLQDAGEKLSQYLQALQVMLTSAIKRGGVSSSEACRHLLRQFCRGCWDNALISELQLEQRETDPPFFSEVSLLLRTEDKQSTKDLRMRKHVSVSKQRTSTYSLCASTDEAVINKAIVSDLKKPITELQGQVEGLKKAKERPKVSHESITRNLQEQVAELQSQIIAVKPAKSEEAKSAAKMSKS